MRRGLIALCYLAVLTGCAASMNTVVYPGTGASHDLREAGVDILGPVEACQGGRCHGQWPMSLTVPPPATTYQAALRKAAAEQYHVPEQDIRLSEITVGFHAEINGIIRGWVAKAIAGRARSSTTNGPGELPSSPQRSQKQPE